MVRGENPRRSLMPLMKHPAGSPLQPRIFIVAKQKPEPSALLQAERLQRALSKIDSRESVARANMDERYQAERNELLEGASPAVLRILEAAKSEVAG
jgi:hypothetical protein